jgi:hypothetical protein
MHPPGQARTDGCSTSASLVIAASRLGRVVRAMRTCATARSTSFAVAAWATLAASEARALGAPPPSPTRDAGAPDGAPPDGGVADAGAAAPDGAAPDAGATDGGAADAGATDGAAADGAMPEAGAPGAEGQPAGAANETPPPPQQEKEPPKVTPLNVGKEGKPPDYYKRRLEPAGFPLIAGSSDTGIQFGLVGTLSYFANGVKPYAWNQDVLVTLSLKGHEGPGKGGIEFAQQAYQWNIDYPGLFNGLVRLNPQVSYTRTINEGYFGLGNASPASPAPAGDIDKARFHEFIENAVLVRGLTRIDFKRPFAILAQPMVRYEVPEDYPSSKLTSDEHARAPNGGPILYGTRPITLVSLAGGFLLDSRDNEIFPRAGIYNEIGARFEEGVPFYNQVRYVELGTIFSGFIPFGETFTLAGRFVANAQLGNVPFYDLLVAGPFQLKEMPGGSSGIRGVPIGRYLAPYKVLGNIEFRGLPIKATLFKQKLRIGGDAFIDAGRTWSTPAFHQLDGDRIGIKYGIGGGAYLLWGQAAIFRLEVAYSPDATATGSLPVGIYVNDGTMF